MNCITKDLLKHYCVFSAFDFRGLLIIIHVLLFKCIFHSIKLSKYLNYHDFIMEILKDGKVKESPVLLPVKTTIDSPLTRAQATGKKIHYLSGIYQSPWAPVNTQPCISYA